MKMITPKTTREIAIADTIWDAFETMASDMGSDRDGLVNQAMFMFARLNGYLAVSNAVAQIPTGVPQMPTMVPSAAKDLPSPAAPAPASRRMAEPEKTPEPPKSEEADFADDFDKEFEAEESAGTPAPAPAAAEPEPAPEEDDFLKDDDNRTPPPPRRSALASPRRSGSPLPPPRRSRFAKPEPEPEPEPEEEPPAEQFDAPPEEEDDRKAVAERVLETAAELERLIKGGDTGSHEGTMEEEAPSYEDKPARRSPAKHSAPEMFITNTQGETKPIGAGPFIIGRGKHCDMVINSGKVSREHAVITCEDGVYFIEDQNSSNGTWFHKQRIKKQQIEDGDEFFICSEKVRFSLG